MNKYQKAEVVEQNLAESLNGDPAHDKPKLDSLKSDIMAGIKLNHDNLRKVSIQ